MSSENQFDVKSRLLHRDQDFLLVGELIADRYEVLALVGKGNMGALYKGRHKEIGRTVAIKVLTEKLSDDCVQLQRFKQEAKIAGSLDHPNVCAVHDFGKLNDGRPYLVMDYIDGPSCSSVISREGAMDSARALRIIINVCEGLRHAHTKGLIHRDLKPSNVMLAQQDNREIAKLVDFGIAKITDADETQSLTSTGEVFGSPLYMSPEQCQGLNIDQRSDIYSLGCMMYELLTGKPPLKGDNAVQTIVKHLNEAPRPFEEVRQGLNVDPKIEAVVMKTVQKDPAQRHQNVDELLHELQLLQELQPTLAPEAPFVDKPRKKNAALYVASAVATLLLIASGTVLYLSSQNSKATATGPQARPEQRSIVDAGTISWVNKKAPVKTQETFIAYVHRAGDQRAADDENYGHIGRVKLHVTAQHHDTNLILCGYAPLAWEVTADPGVKILQVILAGHTEQTCVVPGQKVLMESSYNVKRDGTPNKGKLFEATTISLLEGENPESNQYYTTFRDKLKERYGFDINGLFYSMQTSNLKI